MPRIGRGIPNWGPRYTGALGFAALANDQPLLSSAVAIDGVDSYAQAFVPAAPMTAQQLSVYAQKQVGESTPLVIGLYADSEGLPGALIASGSVAAANISTSYAWVTTAITPTALTPGTRYWIVLTCTGASAGYTWATNTGAFPLVPVVGDGTAGGWVPGLFTAGVAANFRVLAATPTGYETLGNHPPTIETLPYWGVYLQGQATVGVYPATGLLTNQRRNTQRQPHSDLFGFIPPPPPPPPPPIRVTLASHYRRQTEKRRFPLQGWEMESCFWTNPFQPFSIPILDNFERADENPLSDGGSWVGTSLGSVQAGLRLVGGQVRPILATANSAEASHWPTTYGDFAACVTKRDSGTGQVILLARWNTVTTSGYEVVWLTGFGYRINRWDAGSGNPIATGADVTMVAGDKLGCRLVGATIEVWLFHGGVWTLKASVRDATYAQGFAGIGVGNSSSAVIGVIDDFSAVATSQASLQRRLLGPRPPLVIDPPAPPTQQQQTLGVNFASGLLTNQRRNTQRRTTYRLFGFIPQVSAQPPPPISVSFASDLLRRRVMTRRFPLQGWYEIPITQQIGTTIYDDFDRPNGAPGTNWVQALSAYSVPPITSNALSWPQFPSAAWATPFAADQEVRSTINTTNLGLKHLLRFNKLNSGAETGYTVKCSTGPGNIGDASIGKFVNGVESDLQFVPNGVPSGYNHGRATIVGNVITGYASPDGINWTQVVQVTDTTYSGGGFIGLYFGNNSAVGTIDNFSATGTGPFVQSVLTSRFLGPRPPLLLSGLAPEIFEPTGTTMQAVAARVVRQRRAPHSDLFGFIPQVSAQPPPPISITFASDLLRRRAYTRRFPLQGWYETPVNFSAAPVFVTELVAGVDSTTTSNIETITVTGQGTLGNTAVLQYAIRCTTPTVPVVTDTAGNHWTLDNGPLQANNDYVVHFSCRYDKRPLGPGDQITLDLSALAPGLDVGRGYWVEEFRGRLVADQAGNANSTIGVSSGPLGTVTPSVPGEVIVGGACVGSTGLTHDPRFTAFPTGFQDLVGGSGKAADFSYQIALGVGAVTPVESFGSPQGYQGLVTTYKPETPLAGMTLTARFLGPRPPLLLGPVFIAPGIFEPTGTAMQAVAARVARQQRAPHSHLFGFIPQVSAIPPPIQVYLATGLLTTQRRPSQRRTEHFLRPPTVLQTFQGPNVALLPVDRFNRRHRRPPQSNLQPPFFYAATSKIAVTVVRTRPRPTTRRLSYVVYSQSGVGFTHLVRARPRPTTKSVEPPATLQPYSVTIAEDTIRVALARTRPRPTSRRLAPPTALQIFSGPPTPFVHTRPRPTHVISQRGLIFYAQTSEITVTLARTRPRPTRAILAPPAVLQVAVVYYGPAVLVTRIRPRHVVSKLSPAVFYAATSNITVTVVRARPRPTKHVLTAVTYPQSGVGFARLVRTRPRPTTRFLAPPSTLQPYAVTIAEDTVRVTLARTRPRPTTRRIAPPTVLQTFAAPGAPLARTRPRHTAAVVRPPATLEPESLQISERQIRTLLVRTRPRHTVGTKLGYTVYPATSEILIALVKARPRPTTRRLSYVVYAQTSEITVAIVRTRPRPTTALVSPPTTLQTFGPPVEVEIAVRTPLEDRRRQPHSKLSPPTVVIPVGQVYYGPLVALRRIRPVRTHSTLGPPTTLQTFAAGKTPLVRSRPRHTVAIVRPPATLQPYSVTLAEDTIRVVVVRTRPRHTIGTRLSYVVYAATSVIATHLVRTRSKPLTRFVAPPATLQPYAVTLAEDTVRVLITRTRPRPTTRKLSPPTVLQTFEAPSTPLVKTRPRPTSKFLSPPNLEPESVQIAERTIRVLLVHTRPRPKAVLLGEPTTLQIFTGPAIFLTKTRPQPTRRFLNPPTVIRIPSVEQQQQTIRVTLVHARPRPTEKTLRPPTVIRVPSVEQREDTITVALVRTRPRPTAHFIVPPLVKTFPPVVTTLAVTLVAVPARLGWARRFSWNGYEPVHGPQATGGSEFEGNKRRGDHNYRLGPRRPQLMRGVPYLREQTIKVKRVRTRPRSTIYVLGKPTVLQTFGPPVEVEIALRTPVEDRAHRRPRSFAITPITNAATSDIAVAVVRTRPRHTIGTRLRPPTVVEFTTFDAAATPLVHTRPRPTRYIVRPPATLEPESVQIAEREIRVLLVRTRPRATTNFLAPPTAVQRFVSITPTSALVAIRPPKTHSFLRPPTVVRAFVGPPILVTIVRTRPRSQSAAIAPPTRLRPVETTIRVHLARIRPRHVQHIEPLVRVEAEPPVVTTFLPTHLVQTRPRPTHHFLTPFTTFARPVTVFQAPPILVVTVRIRPPHIRSTRITPFPFFPGRDGFTTSTVVATAGGADSAVVVTGGALDAVISDDADSTIIVVTGGDIEDVLTDGGDILDRPGGLT